MGQTATALAAPDTQPDDIFSAEARDSAAYASEAAGRIAAQYRFAGLIAGIKGPNDTDRDVEEARAALIDAIQDFLTPDPRPLEQQIQSEFDAYRQERDAVERNILESGIYFGTGDIFPLYGHPSDQGPGRMESIASDAADEHLANAIAQSGVGPEHAEQLWSLRRRAQNIGALETQRRQKALADLRKTSTGFWARIKAYYDDKIALIRDGKYLLATTKIVVDGIEVFHADIAIALISAGVIAITAGVTAVAAPLIVSAVAAAMRVVKVGAGVLGRTADGARHAAAAGIFSIKLHRVDKSALDMPVARPHSHYEHQVDVSRDLTDDEKLLLNEENQGTTEPTDDAGQQGRAALAHKLQRDQDYDEIMAGLSPETVELAARAGASVAQQKARKSIMETYWAKFGQDATMASGMNTKFPMRIVKYPPPDVLGNWRAEGAPMFGNYYDPSGGAATPNQLGINSAGRVKATIDVSDRPGIAFEGVGSSIDDNWTVTGPMATRKTAGGVTQWHIASLYKPEMADKIEDVMTWRELPGNKHWVEAEREGRFVQEDRGAGYPKWYLDGDAVPEAEGDR